MRSTLFSPYIAISIQKPEKRGMCAFLRQAQDKPSLLSRTAFLKQTQDKCRTALDPLFTAYSQHKYHLKIQP